METVVLNISIPASVRMTPCLPRFCLLTLWMGVTLTGKMLFWGDNCSSKVDYAMKFQDDPLTTQLLTLWMGVILTGKMAFCGDKGSTKVDIDIKTCVLNIPALVRMTPCLPDSFNNELNIKHMNDKTCHPTLIPLKSLTFKCRQTCYHSFSKVFYSLFFLEPSLILSVMFP